MNLAMMYRTIASQIFLKLYTLEAINLMITVYLSIQLKKEPIYSTQKGTKPSVH
jgi:hypothetical protein